MKIEFEDNNFWYIIPTVVIGKDYNGIDYRYCIRIAWLKWFFGIMWGTDI